MHASWYTYHSEKSARAAYRQLRDAWVVHTGGSPRTFDRACTRRVEEWIASDAEGDGAYTEAGQVISDTPEHRLYLEAADHELAHGRRLRRKPVGRR